MRKTLATVLATTLIVMGILTGCSSSSSSNEATSSGKNGQEEKVEISVWAMGNQMKEFAQQFEKENPNIKVNVQTIPWGAAHDKLLTAVASKKGPDVVQMGTTWIPEFATAKALMDLTPYLDKYPEFGPDNFYPGSVETATFEGAYVGVPWYIDTRFLYYRTDLLKEVGYDHAPATWEELQDAALKLKQRGDNKYGILLDPKESSLGFMFARQNGSKLIDDAGKPLFNESQFVETVDYLNSFFKNGSAPLDLGIDMIQTFKGEGVTPMFISGPWMVKMVQDQAPELEGKWATAVLPKKENNISTLGGSNLSVFQYTKQPEAAMKFVAWMSQPETQLKWMEVASEMPAAKKAWETEKLQSDPNYKVIGEQLKSARPLPLIKQWEEIAQNYMGSFEKVIRAGDDVKQEMDAFNQKADQILNK